MVQASMPQEDVVFESEGGSSEGGLGGGSF